MGEPPEVRSGRTKLTRGGRVEKRSLVSTAGRVTRPSWMRPVARAWSFGGAPVENAGRHAMNAVLASLSPRRKGRMEYRILGPLEVLDAGRSMPLGGGKQRALLATLLLSANEAVSGDRLVDEIWGERPPETASKLVQGYVSGLRKSPGNVIVTRPPGYVVHVGNGELDALEVGRLAEEARAASATGDLERASDRLTRALGLWRGIPLADVQLNGVAASEAERLAALRLTVLLDKNDVDLELARHADLVGALETLAVQHPLQERVRGQLMLALYRSGRQAEALDVYRDTRHTLVEGLGLEPGGALQQLEAAI